VSEYMNLRKGTEIVWVGESSPFLGEGRNQVRGCDLTEIRGGVAVSKKG